MKQLGHLKTYKMKLTTLSPVFIGGGEFSDLSQLQYVLKSGELKIVDEAKFMQFLIKTKQLDNFIKYVSMPLRNQKGQPLNPTLSNWINQNFPNQNLDIYKRIEKVENVATRNLNCVRTFVKDKNGRPFIPGSSIKGAIRTALMAKLIKNGLNKKEATEYLNNQMRFIQVTDSKSQPTNTLMYRQTQHQQLIKEQDLMNVDNDLKEILKEGLIVYFDIVIDKSFKYDIENLLSIISEFYSEVYRENKALNNIASDLKTSISVTNCPPNINIGGQSGFNTKVVLRAMSSDDIDYMRRKKEALGNMRAFKKHGHITAKIAPRCLKVVERFKDNDDTLMPLGWCNISLAE